MVKITSRATNGKVISRYMCMGGSPPIVPGVGALRTKGEGIPLTFLTIVPGVGALHTNGKMI